MKIYQSPFVVAGLFLALFVGVRRVTIYLLVGVFGNAFFPDQPLLHETFIHRVEDKDAAD